MKDPLITCIPLFTTEPLLEALGEATEVVFANAGVLVTIAQRLRQIPPQTRYFPLFVLLLYSLIRVKQVFR